MFRAWLQNIQKTRKCTGIEVIPDGADGYRMSAITLVVDRDDVKTDTIVHNARSIQELSVKKDLPVTLVVNGKGIVLKKINAASADAITLETVLPQANPNDFYVQYRELGGCTIAAIARRSLIDGLLQAFDKAGYIVADIHFGFPVLDMVIPFIDTASCTTIPLAHYSVHLGQQGITGFTPHPETSEHMTDEYVLGNQYIQAPHLLPYAAALLLLAQSPGKVNGTQPEQIGRNREQLTYRKYYQAAGLSFVALLFLLLVINFLLYNHYYTLNREIAASRGISQRELHKTAALQQQIARKEKFLTRSGWLKPARAGFLADRFAALLPSDIWFTGLSFHPLRSTYTDAGNLYFKQDTILLAGTCLDAAQINVFISNLKTMKEVREVNMKEYGYRKEEDAGEFTLEIITR